MTLTEFLLARISEDEAEARDDDGSPTPVGMWDPDRVLAECEAKRRIVEDYARKLDSRRDHPDDLALAGATLALHSVVKALARAYVDHPDYREEWRP